MTNRRDFLKLTAAAGLATTPLFSIAQSEDLVFACPTAMSGTFSAIGKFSEIGVRYAVEQQGTLLGRSFGIG